MLILTISRRDEAGHTEPLVAISDPQIIHSVLASMRTLANEEEEDPQRADKLKVVRVPERGMHSER